MKPNTRILVVAAIAISSGATGYLIGRGQSASVRPQQSENELTHTTRPTSSGRVPLAASFDSKGLQARLDAEKNPLLRFKMAQQNLEQWIDTSPDAALDWLRSQQPTERRDELIRMALQQYAEADSKGAANWALKNLSGNDLNNNLISIAENWAEQNGAEAANWFLALPQTQQRDAAMENLVFAWASNEPQAAVGFLEANPAMGELTSTLQRAALAGWAKTDPLQAVSTSRAISQKAGDPSLLANTLANWATVDLEASTSWLLSNLQPGEERAAAAQELAVIYAQQSPDSGIAWLAKLSPGNERDAAASSLVAAWARGDAAAAAKWAATQSISTLTADSTMAVIRNLQREDPQQFENWKNSLPPGPLRKQAEEAVPTQEQ